MASVPAVPSVAQLQSAFARALLDELARGGVAELVVCPGSRSTPVVLAALATPSLRLHVRLDERSAGFFAIGRALVSGRPVGVVVTSGTAAAELAASVAEADRAGVPLVVVTADRPPELRGVGAPQTIDQVKLFGGAVRRFEDPGTVRPGSEGSWRPLAARLVSAARDGRGPVHLNLSLVEPLDAPPSTVPDGRAGDAPWRTTWRPEQAPTGPLADLAGARVAVLAGRGAGAPRGLLGVAARHGWPLLADALSGARFDDPHVVVAVDALVGDAPLRDALRPDAVLAVGAPPASRALADALVGWAPRVLAVTAGGWPDDPNGLVTDVVWADPSAWAAAVAGLGPLGGPPGYLGAWRAADDAAQATFEAACATELSEPAVARALSRIVPEGVPLVAASSMPVRDLEWFGATRAEPPTVLANRGANGIDGVVSTALGAAAGGAAVGLLGDLAFLHDAGALGGGVGEHGGRCVLVVVDNRGGGIFSFLPQRRSVPEAAFERLFATPPRVAVADVAGGFGCDVREVKDLAGLAPAVHAGLDAEGVTVVVVSVPDRDRNAALHRELGDAARAAARGVLGKPSRRP
jgi:2-succinyl-5-enolpyruvyl-6-hydroxy-3-cyclohexene-1-carboxylate synthase